MHPDDPFPIERCSPRLGNVILAVFQGRCPTIQEVFSISPKQWLKVPGMGPTLLNEMEASMRGYQGWAKGRASERITDAELIARLERLQRDLERFRRDLLILMSERQSKDGSSDDADLH